MLLSASDCNRVGNGNDGWKLLAFDNGVEISKRRSGSFDTFWSRWLLRSVSPQQFITVANAIDAAKPLDTASSRMQTRAFGKSKGLWKILAEGTWKEAFDGLGLSLLLTANPSIQYTVFDQLKLRALEVQQSHNQGIEPSQQALSAFSAFVLGAVSKCVATCLTYPAIRS